MSAPAPQSARQRRVKLVILVVLAILATPVILVQLLASREAGR